MGTCKLGKATALEAFKATDGEVEGEQMGERGSREAKGGCRLKCGEKRGRQGAEATGSQQERRRSKWTQGGLVQNQRSMYTR